MTVSNSNAVSIWSILDLSDDSLINSEIPIRSPFVIGRRSKADLVLECSSVSGIHAELIIQDDQLQIKDRGSTNGTFVNGQRVLESQLREEDIVQVGSMVFQVNRISDAPAPAASRRPAQTVESDIPESAEGRFHRLLRVGVVPFFQPVLDITGLDITGNIPKTVGYEVLGRGRLPGLCTPEEMFSAASEMEKAAELSEALRKNGIEVADAHFSSGKMIFVNTHQTELISDRLGESLAKIRTRFPDRKFNLEVPASILTSPEKLSVVDSATRDLNIGVSVHGIGAEMLPLAALQRLNPAVGKVSVDLIRDIDKKDVRKHKLVSAIISMLNELGIQPMAERVETAEEHETLKQLGVQLGQGYYYGQPTSIEDVNEHRSAALSALPPLPSRSKPEKASPKLEIEKATPKPAKAVSEELVSEETAQRRRKSDGIGWVLEQPKDYFTIQVMVTISRSSALDYTAKQDDPENFVIYSKQGKRRDLFVVIRGAFASRAAAKVAAEKLKDSTIFPLIRTFKNVQSEAQKSIS